MLPEYDAYLITVAVIGTRNPTEFGIQEGYKLTKHFVENNFTIVSGLALGCDTVGHSCCLEHKGRTIAVLPNGVDKIYPKQNTKLASEIIKNGGALISEYPPGTAPKRNYFVERDRLQRELSNGICIIETKTKGGTMHTYKFVKKQNKQVGLV
ncbi:DNA-processing protein DprA [Formosa sp. PL04]|uniref:DNA-processing protein DprA n=1 Tax=Formosa sp. PL04 TaxID=3081755 RepID=UPI002980E522|nr:DNA-processing protein DprA [Formosa sp. PL04]MDW5290975.1 DNA-processing protein DprA [Formosa sp. PL04]